MRKRILMTIAASCLISCVSMKNLKSDNQDLSGIYKRQESTEKLELKTDSTYTLFHSEHLFTPVFEQCEIASKGRWSVLSNDILELTSEDKFLKQKGFEYLIKKENKLSQDSLYIHVNFSDDFEPPVNLRFSFNFQKEVFLEKGKTFIALPKSKYLLGKSSNSINKNHISFSLNANISGTTIYKGRILFDMFEEDIDTEKTNFLTVSLPNFERCFFEFEPLNKELIYIKSYYLLFWQGDFWKKQL